MKFRFIAFFVVTIVIIAAFVIVFTSKFSSDQGSTIVICGEPVETFGFSGVIISNETITTFTSGMFAPQGTVYSTVTTNVTFATTPGFSTSFSSLENCTYVRSKG